MTTTHQTPAHHIITIACGDCDSCDNGTDCTNAEIRVLSGRSADNADRAVMQAERMAAYKGPGCIRGRKHDAPYGHTHCQMCGLPI